MTAASREFLDRFAEEALRSQVELPRQPHHGFLVMWMAAASALGVELEAFSPPRGVRASKAVLAARAELCRRACAELGMSPQEVARELGCDPGTVRNALKLAASTGEKSCPSQPPPPK